MKAWIPFTLVLALGTAVSAHATCTYPQPPAATPDGSTATKDQMVAAAQDFKRYNGEMNSYLDCLKLETDAVTPKDPSKLTADEKKQAMAQAYAQNHAPSGAPGASPQQAPSGTTQAGAADSSSTLAKS